MFLVHLFELLEELRFLLPARLVLRRAAAFKFGVIIFLQLVLLGREFFLAARAFRAVLRQLGVQFLVQESFLLFEVGPERLAVGVQDLYFLRLPRQPFAVVLGV